MRRTAATVVLLLSLAAAASAGVQQPAPAPEVVRPCSSRGDGSRPQQQPSPPGVRLGPIVLWPSIRTRVEGYESPSGWSFFVKAPAVVPARTVVTLAVPPEAAHLVALHGAGGRWVSSVRFEACRPGVRAFPGAYDGTVGRYTGFPFAFALARRSLCVPLEAWVEGRPTPIRRLVPFGRARCR